MTHPFLWIYAVGKVENRLLLSECILFIFIFIAYINRLKHLDPSTHLFLSLAHRQFSYSYSEITYKLICWWVFFFFSLLLNWQDATLYACKKNFFFFRTLKRNVGHKCWRANTRINSIVFVCTKLYAWWRVGIHLKFINRIFAGIDARIDAYQISFWSSTNNNNKMTQSCTL